MAQDKAIGAGLAWVFQFEGKTFRLATTGGAQVLTGALRDCTKADSKIPAISIGLVLGLPTSHCSPFALLF